MYTRLSPSIHYMHNGVHARKHTHAGSNTHTQALSLSLAHMYTRTHELEPIKTIQESSICNTLSDRLSVKCF